MFETHGDKQVKLTNQTNKEIAQMNNDYNYKMFQEQQQYNWDMWNAENEYNSASNQRKRLEEAGLNPYIMMDGGSAGTATSGNPVNPPRASEWQAQSSAQAHAMDVQNMIGIAGQLADVGQKFAQNNLLGQQARQYEIQNAFLGSNLGLKNIFLGTQIEGMNLGNQYGRETMRSRILQAETLAEIYKIEKQGKDLDNQWKALDVKQKDKYVNTWFDHIQATNLNLIDQQMKSYEKGRELSDAHIFKAYKDALLADEQTNKLYNENEAFKKYVDDYVEYQKNQFKFMSDYFGGSLTVQGPDGDFTLPKGQLKSIYEVEGFLDQNFGTSNNGPILGPVVNFARWLTGHGSVKL